VTVDRGLCSTFTVVSWNIELGLDLSLAAHELLSTQGLPPADVLLAQELSPGQAVELADFLGWDHHYYAPDRHKKTGQLFGNAVLSPWPLRPLIGADLEHSAPIQGQQRGVTGAHVLISDQPIAAFSTHLETPLLSVRRRLLQVRSLVRAVNASSQSLPTVVGGDFNTASRRSQTAVAGELQSVGLELVTSPMMCSFRRFRREFSLDHIHGRELRSVASGVAATQASDHDPVWASLESIDECAINSARHDPEGAS